MIEMGTYKKILVIAVLVSGFLLPTYALTFTPFVQKILHAHAVINTSKNLNEEVTVWRQEIKHHGAEAAYKALIVVATRELSEELQHHYGHVFGQALYDEVGIDGFPICEEKLLGGCSHQFLGESVRYEGVSAVITLNNLCREQRGERNAITCQHGLGHGLVSYFGYTVENLSKSLAVCSTISSINQTWGCYGGVFMEFNLRTMANGAVRPLSEKHPFQTCEALSEEYQEACYFWHPQWLRDSLFDNDRSVQAFRKVGFYCDSLEKSEWTSACFQGIGYFSSGSPDLDSENPKTFCNTLSDIQKNRDSCLLVASE